MNSAEPIEIVICIRLGDANGRTHLMPLALDPRVSRIWVVRHKEFEHGPIPKVAYRLIPTKWKLVRLIQMLMTCIRLGRRKDVRMFASFNPFPYGLLCYLAARLTGKPIHIGFIGSDWNRTAKTKIGRFFLRYLRRADFISVTGKTMQQELVESGFASDRIRILPHGIDLERFPIAADQDKQYTGVFIGRLIPLKCVDVLIDALARVCHTHPQARLCIVGDGPCRKDLQQQAERLHLSDNIDFVGYQTDVYPYLCRSRMLWLTSEHEGYPIVIVEALAAGLVPITTAVGCIPDWIVDGENGLLISDSNPDEMARTILALLDDDHSYSSIQNTILNQREQLSHDAGTTVWNEWLITLNQ